MALHDPFGVDVPLNCDTTTSYRPRIYETLRSLWDFKGYRTSSTIHLCIHEQMQTPNELVSSGCSCSCIHNSRCISKRNKGKGYVTAIMEY